jgi:hypothetical protein
MMKELNTKTDNEKIIEFLTQDGDDIKLSKTLQLKIERMDFCHDLIKKYGSRTRIAPLIMSKYHVSKAQAYRIFQDTQDVFGSTHRTSREFWLDILLGFMMDSRQKATIKGDFRSVAAIEKNMASAIEKLAGTKESIPFEKIQPAPIMIGFFPETLKVDLPDDWEEQVKQIIKPKRTIDRLAHDAELIDEEESGD